MTATHSLLRRNNSGFTLNVAIIFNASRGNYDSDDLSKTFFENLFFFSGSFFSAEWTPSHSRHQFCFLELKLLSEIRLFEKPLLIKFPGNIVFLIYVMYLRPKFWKTCNCIKINTTLTETYALDNATIVDACCTFNRKSTYIVVLLSYDNSLEASLIDDIMM